MTMRAVSRLLPLIGLVCGPLACSASPPSTTGTAVRSGSAARLGAPAPDFSAEFVTGEGPKTLAEARGKVVILDFWATFCLPCKKSFPAYQKLIDESDGNVVVVAVSLDEPENVTRQQLVKFAGDAGARFTILWDTQGAIRGPKYEVPSMPTSYIIDREGVARYRHVRYEDGDLATIAAEIRALL